ncbi:DNA-binding protein [Photobacterium frigidiphilum]|uniref:DNA-binding protein n=1 Tax=Photobacterium frigidiphilum TaxID=264736 RepID=A0A2T3JB15_9GAMM|nr:YbaK/EbsC family protein [Photobacterium frigidiphilum]PSU46037.1 DNA-binding protein [Photobacterium frigidiphilum]
MSLSNELVEASSPNKIDQIYQINIDLFTQAGVHYQAWQHEPILDFDTDQRISDELGITAAPTKSLFMKLKGGGHCLLLTHRDNRLDSKLVKSLVGKRVSICSNEEMIAAIGCEPGAVCPFGLPNHVTLLIDPVIYSYPELMFTPGKPEVTFAFASNQLDSLLARLTNQIIHLPVQQ